MDTITTKKIQILGIAPYGGLKHLMQTLAAKRDDLAIDIVTANSEYEIKEVFRHSSIHYDAIISDSVTAKEIKNNISIPVIEIPLSAYDILRTIKLIEYHHDKIAVVGSSAITSNAKLLCDLLQYDIDIFTANRKEEIPQTLKSLKDKNYNFILCDSSIESAAKEENMTPILITPGIESVQSAFNAAINTYHELKKLQNENAVLEEALKAQSHSNFIFNSTGELIKSHSNYTKEITSIERYLSELIHSLKKESFDKTFHLINDNLYSVSLRVIQTDIDHYYAFSVESSPVPLNGSKYGIRFSNKLEMHDYYYNSFYSLTSGFYSMNDQINCVNQTSQPIMILGEKGTGKDHMAAKIYIESSLSCKPYVSINCELINQKYWTYLINNYNSPLCDNDNTIFISNIQALSPLQRKQLLSLALDANLCKRNRVIFSCSKTLTNSNEDPARDYIDYLPCITLTLPPLRELTNDLASSSSLYLSKLNIEHSKEIMGFEPDAMDILKSYSWPQNYMQLKRVLLELVMLTDTPYIQADLVSQLIEKEKIQFPENRIGREYYFDYNQTLNEINRDIIQHVLKQNNGNQSKVAKQLGISRTTIWRYLN